MNRPKTHAFKRGAWRRVMTPFLKVLSAYRGVAGLSSCQKPNGGHFLMALGLIPVGVGSH